MASFKHNGLAWLRVTLNTELGYVRTINERKHMPKLTTLIGGLSFTECPRWRDGRLYVSDFYTHRVLAVALDGTAETLAHVPQQPSGLGFLPDGRLLIVSMRDRKVLRREVDGSLDTYADLSGLAPWYLNDMLVGDDGRAWVGNFGFDLMGGAPASTTVLICIESDGTAKVAAERLGFPNGMVLTPDGRTLIVAESTMNRLSAFNVALSSLSEGRTWAAFGDPPTTMNAREILGQVAVAADGICLDAEGAVWVADAAHGRLIRVAEGGRIMEELKTDGLGAFACMLGGEDGRTLFACVAPTYHEAEASANHRASILMTKVKVPHAGLP
ncbi:MAG: SMP-30/gluconolactonase/LRE family protein [Candidatus Acidiferrales bacterium]